MHRVIYRLIASATSKVKIPAFRKNMIRKKIWINDHFPWVLIWSFLNFSRFFVITIISTITSTKSTQLSYVRCVLKFQDLINIIHKGLSSIRFLLDNHTVFVLIQYTVHIVQYIAWVVYSVQYTLYNAQYSVYSTKYTVLGIVYSHSVMVMWPQCKW